MGVSVYQVMRARGESVGEHEGSVRVALGAVAKANDVSWGL